MTLWPSPLENAAPERGALKRTVSSKSRLRFPEFVFGGKMFHEKYSLGPGAHDFFVERCVMFDKNLMH